MRLQPDGLDYSSTARTFAVALVTRQSELAPAKQGT